MFRRRGRRSPREQREAVNASMRFYGMPSEFQTELKPVRQRSTPGADGRPLERDVLKAVIKVLRADPRVASVERNQSGLLQDGERLIRVGSRGKLDLTVYLKCGLYLELEVKRDQRTIPDEHQLQRVEYIRRSGGLAGWCWSPESALALLPT
jgi:hypothetical protein